MIDSDDLSLYFFAYFKRGSGIFKPFVRDLRNVNETVDSFFEFDKRAERNDSYDFALYNVADLIFTGNEIPGLGLKLFISQRNFLGFFVAFKNFEFVFFADFENVGRSVAARPGQIGNVSKTVNAVNVYERTESSKSYDRAFDDIADGYGAEEFFFFFSSFSVSLSLFGFENNSLRSNDLFSLAVFDLFGFKS